ncbi:MAG TPA: sulfite exporter TauE/SafE family protein, partial [Amaricoccus sp.]|nr:sulfite exporter TauE/SafE family protein [Amaricoccus sp.]
MIYIIGMPTKVVVGTSVFQFLFVTGFTAVLHATQSGTVDVMLALLLLIGGVIGAQVGVGLAARLRAEQLRIMLALLVVGVCLKLFADLVIRPEELFSVTFS